MDECGKHNVTDKRQEQTNTYYMMPFYIVQNYSKLIHGVRKQNSIYFWRGQRRNNQEETQIDFLSTIDYITY